LLWICLYLYFIPVIIKFKFSRHFFRLAVLVSVVYFVHSFYAISNKALFTYHQKLLMPVNYYSSKTSLYGGYYRNYFDNILNTLADKNIYHLPKPFFDARKAEPIETPFALQIEKVNSETLYLLSETINYPKDGDVFILLNESNNKPLLFPVMYIRNSANRLLASEGSLFKGCQTAFSRNDFPEDKYTIGLAIWKNNRLFYSKTNFLFDSKAFNIITY